MELELELLEDDELLDELELAELELLDDDELEDDEELEDDDELEELELLDELEPGDVGEDEPPQPIPNTIEPTAKMRRVRMSLGARDWIIMEDLPAARTDRDVEWSLSVRSESVPD